MIYICSVFFVGMMMVIDKPEETTLPGPKNINTTVRRTFLKRATAGALIASIPSRSAWAGIAGSIVASGHSSDFQQGKCTKLQGRSYFENGNNGSYSFHTEFGSLPFDRTGAQRSSDVTFSQICGAVLYLDANKRNLSDIEKNALKDIFGVSRINLLLFIFYFNAKYNASDSNIEYNAVSQHGGLSHFATYLYGQAATVGPRDVARLLRITYQKYKNGKAC